MKSSSVADAGLGVGGVPPAPQARKNARRRGRRVLPGFSLTLGVTLTYLGILVLLPLAGLFGKASTLSWSEFLGVTTNSRAIASYAITLGAAAAAVAFNAVYGLLLAWVLVRYDFPGRRLLDAVVDLPFALPTAVAGLALATLGAPNGWYGEVSEVLGFKIAFTPLGIALAMAFTSVPFVIRTVQPVLEDLEPELEEAARSLGATDWQVFRRVVFPAILPAYVTGCVLSFARALGEFGAIIFIAGNLPYKTEITALLIFIRLEEYDYGAATAIAVVVLLTAFFTLLAVNILQAWFGRWNRKV